MMAITARQYRNSYPPCNDKYVGGQSSLHFAVMSKQVMLKLKGEILPSFEKRGFSIADFLGLKKAISTRMDENPFQDRE